MNRELKRVLLILGLIALIVYGIPALRSSLGPVEITILFALLIGLAGYFMRRR